MEKKRILFVDDQPNVLNGLRRMLRKMRDEWGMEFVTSGAAALEAMTRQAFDVVVTDMRMPEMDGAELLAIVKSRYPGTVRFVLSGHSEQELLLRSVGQAHQFLAKPCDPENLIGTIQRSCALHDMLNADHLASIVSGMTSLPVLPSLHAELVEVMSREDSPLSLVEEIISKDVAMTAKILQVVNSAFFALPTRIESPGHAVSYLGLETVQGLVLGASIFSKYNGVKSSGFSQALLYDHCLRVGSIAREIAREMKESRYVVGDSFIAGMLHDVGKIVLAVNFPSEFSVAIQEAKSQDLPLLEAEREVLGANHADIGGYLLGLWGLPDTVVEAVTFHHNPSACLSNGFDVLTAVHAANALDYEEADIPEHGMRTELDTGYLAILGVEDRLSDWREIGKTIKQETIEHEESASR